MDQPKFNLGDVRYGLKDGKIIKIEIESIARNNFTKGYTNEHCYSIDQKTDNLFSISSGEILCKESDIENFTYDIRNHSSLVSKLLEINELRCDFKGFVDVNDPKPEDMIKSLELDLDMVKRVSQDNIKAIEARLTRENLSAEDRIDAALRLINSIK